MTDYPDPLSLAGSLLSPIELTSDWQNDGLGWVAKFRRLWFRPYPGEYHAEDWNYEQYDVYYPLSTGQKPPGEKGTRAFAVFRGRWEIVAFGEFGGGDAKELFPAVVYKRIRTEIQEDDTTIEIPETFVICPGGRSERPVSTVHVLHVEGKTVSKSTFGSLPMAMANFGAAIAENGYGSPTLVCTPGEIESGTRYPVQRFDFVQEEWSKTDTEQSLVGCPAYVNGNDVFAAGGQSAYYVSPPIQMTSGGINGSQPTWGHVVSPLWKVDQITGAVETALPRRRIASGFSAQPESTTVNNEKRFLKQNFTGIQYSNSQDGKSVDFIAVGGSELLGYQSKAVVSYTLNSTYGPYVDYENNENRIESRCITFPDTPLPLGECGAVRVRKMKGKNVDLLVCVGGRYKKETEVEITMPDGSKKKVKKIVFELHKKPWSLNLENPSEGWRNDLFPELSTPRINAALSDVVTTIDTVTIADPVTGEVTEKKLEHERIFLIGGRTENGLTASVEAFNLTKGEWETDWPGLDGRTPQPKEN